MTISACEDADDLCARALDLADGGDARRRLGADLRRCTEITAPQMRALDLVRLEKFAQNVGDGVECHVFPTEVDVEGNVAHGGMHMECDMPALPCAVHQRLDRAGLLPCCTDRLYNHKNPRSAALIESPSASVSFLHIILYSL